MLPAWDIALSDHRGVHRPGGAGRRDGEGV